MLCSLPPVAPALRQAACLPSPAHSLPPSSLAILKAREVIALNQDKLGMAGDLIWKQGPKEARGVRIGTSHSIRRWHA